MELPIYFLNLQQTEPTGLGVATVVFSKIDTYGTPQNCTYRAWEDIELPKYFLKFH